MARVLVLGGGMIGSAMAADLAADPRLEVTVADRSPEALARLAALRGVALEEADLSDPAVVKRLASGHDVVLGALSSTLGFRALRAVLEAGRDCVDISFMAENALELDALARERGACAVVDCGVAPGLSNLLCGYAAARLAPCERLVIYVGGLPRLRRWPWQYQAPFAPADVLEEYTRPARLVEDGRLVVCEALSEPELIDLPGVGTLEAFLTDGLRSLVHSLRVPWMKEKTLRYPGHLELMRVLRHAGFFSKEPLEAGGTRVRPLDLTSALLFRQWAFAPGEEDLTVMRVRAEGRLDGRAVNWTWDLLDRRDPVTGTRSMSRATAFPAVILARFLLEGRWRRPGVHPPEVPGGEPGLLDAVLAELEPRGIHLHFHEGSDFRFDLLPASPAP